MSKQEAKERALEMIKLVGIPMPEKYLLLVLINCLVE